MLNAAPEGDLTTSGGAPPSVANRLDDEANTATQQAQMQNQPEATLVAVVPPSPLLRATTLIEPSAADGFSSSAPTASAQPTLLLYAALPTELPQAAGAVAIEPANDGSGEMQSAAQAPEAGIAQQQLDQQSTIVAELSVDAAAALAATFPPMTVTPAATTTPPPSATLTPSLSATLTFTVTPQPSATLMPTLTAPLLPPVPATSPVNSADVGIVLIILALLLFAAAIVTTFLRRRS